MKHEQDFQNDPTLGKLLRDARWAPGLPPGFADGVWRRIDRSEAAAGAPIEATGWLDRLAQFILRPRFAAVAAGVILLAGSLAGSWEGRQMARQDAQLHYLASVVPHMWR